MKMPIVIVLSRQSEERSISFIMITIDHDAIDNAKATLSALDNPQGDFSQLTPEQLKALDQLVALRTLENATK